MKQIQQGTIFCSYAHEDQLFVHQLKIHFAALKRLHSWVFWTDMEIRPGEEWEQRIREHLDTAQVILLLISPDFMKSDYCYSEEMMRAMERHEQKEACVIPVLLRPVPHWMDAPFGKLQVLPPEGRPVTDRYWGRVDDALCHVMEKISQVVVDMYTRENDVSTTSLVDQGPTKPDSTQVVPEQPYTIASPILEALPTSSPLAADGFVQIQREGVKIFEHQDEAYDFLIQGIQRYGAKEAVLLQYSCNTSLKVLRALLRKGARVTVYIQHEDIPTKIGSNYQADRVRYTTMNLREMLGDALLKPSKLKVYKYRTPCSISAIKIDNRVLCMGWYTYGQKAYSDHKAYPDDTIELSGHDRAAVVVWRGPEDFWGLDKTFSVSEEKDGFNALDNTFQAAEKDYRKHREAVPF